MKNHSLCVSSFMLLLTRLSPRTILFLPEMEKDEANKKVNGFTGRLTNEFDGNSLQWQKNITIIDLSDRNITDIENHVKLPPNLVELNLSHNKLQEVPSAVMDLENLKSLDISFNSITFFDDTPNFHCTIECLNLSHNNLKGPPFWIWYDTQNSMQQLNLSFNMDIAKSLTNEYYDQILSYKTSVTDIHVHNCGFKCCLKFMSTFPKARSVTIGVKDFNYIAANQLIELPCAGLDQCCDIERLNASNTYIYSINSNIDMYKNLLEIDLSLNSINSLPNEFCNLEKLEICLLSCNKLLYLPEDIHKLNKLVNLHLDCNEICMLPERFCELQNLALLDLYDNCLYEFPEDMCNIKELDLAQNYLNEPQDEEYIAKKEKLRLNKECRRNERKIEVIRAESEHSTNVTDDEELMGYLSSSNNIEVPQSVNPPSSPEDWDSDDYWMPRYYTPAPPVQSPWLYFVKHKMEEGNFCPMDLHTVSVYEMVKYEKVCNPQDLHESDGQFDDYSGDDS